MDWTPAFSPAVVALGKLIYKRWFKVYDDLQCIKSWIEKVDLRLQHLEDEVKEIDNEVMDIKKFGCHKLATPHA